MTSRTAACSCGQLRVQCEGEAVRVSMCHCPACQRRTGSVFGVQHRFPEAAVRVEGRTQAWTRHVDDGDQVHYLFCPVCASTVLWRIESLPGFVAVAAGAFADPQLPAPSVSVWEATRHAWVTLPEGIEHYD